MSDADKKRLSCFTEYINQRRDKNDGRSRRYVIVKRQQQSAQASGISDRDRQPHHLFERAGKKIGGNLWYGKHGDNQYDTHYAQAGYNRQRDEAHHDIFYAVYRQMLRPCELGVEGDRQKRPQKYGETKNGYNRDGSQKNQVAVTDCKNIAEQVRAQFRREARSQKAADDTDAHAQRPEYGDGRVFAHVSAVAEPLYAPGGQNRKDSRRQDGRKPHEYAETYAAERGMRNAAADEYKAACHNICPDKAT